LFPNWAIFSGNSGKKKQKIFAGVWCEHDFVNFLRKGDTEIAGVNPPNDEPLFFCFFPFIIVTFETL